VAIRQLNLVLFSVFGDGIAIIRQKSYTWQRDIQESMREGMQPRMPVRPGVASVSRGNGNPDESQNDDNAAPARGHDRAKRKRTKGQIGSSPDLKFAKLGRATLALAEHGFRTDAEIRVPETEWELPVVIRFVEFKPPFRGC
jgi:hypothetical protein